VTQAIVRILLFANTHGSSSLYIIPPYSICQEETDGWPRSKCNLVLTTSVDVREIFFGSAQGRLSLARRTAPLGMTPTMRWRGGIELHRHL